MLSDLLAVYLLVVSRLLNYIYYPQVAGLDDDKLYRNVRNVLLYSMVELFSFLLLQYLLKKRLRLSVSLQLSFVLETQWPMVQSKLVLWVVYIVQASLVHFGALVVLDRRRICHSRHAAPSVTDPGCKYVAVAL